MLVSGYSSTCRCLWLEITCTYVRLCDDILNYFIFLFFKWKIYFSAFHHGCLDAWMQFQRLWFSGWNTFVRFVSIYTHFFEDKYFCVLFIWLCITNSCHDFHYFCWIFLFVRFIYLLYLLFVLNYKYFFIYFFYFDTNCKIEFISYICGGRLPIDLCSTCKR